MDPYKKSSVLSNPYAVRKEPGVDLRAEFHKLMIDTDQVATWMVYRRVKTDDRGLPIKHPDVHANRSGEIPRDVLPAGSTNNGYLFDDYVVQAYMNHSQAYSITNRFKRAGESSVDYKTVYLEYDFLAKATGNKALIPNNLDKIIRLRQDIEGNLISPTQIIEHYDILSVDPYRLDSGGRIEYYRMRVISVADESFQQ